jgi:hypothetical protein
MNDDDVRAGQERPSIARTYDYLIGGREHYAIDEQYGKYFREVLAGSEQIAVCNRRTVERAVRLLAREGIRQFIDFGCGLPTRENVHQIARRQQPGCRVVYLDNDPIVVSHGLALLAVDENIAVFQGDVRDPQSIHKHAEVQRLISFDEPVGLLFSAVLGFIDGEDDPAGLVRYWTGQIASGSLVYVSCFRSGDDRQTAVLQHRLREVIGRGGWHSEGTIADIFTGLELLEPGIVPTVQWRPEQTSGAQPSEWERLIVSGLGRKP